MSKSMVPLRLISPRAKEERRSRFPSVGGTDPVNLLPWRYKYSKDVRFPTESGIGPWNFVFDRLKRTSGLLLQFVWGRAPVRL
ncbi:hypothetical protein CRG98_049730 [Punica granatum]|uniref:Uncharacterized protein n=1 Tax=Punica granatum TaxID=22663 RepID=A0A2I0H2M7_PUNGR|nr:hypothetical protein CRG98_049730 [Punica granatum]